MLQSVTGRVSRGRDEMEEEKYLIVMERLIVFRFVVELGER